MATLMPYLTQPFFDSNGVPLAGGKLYSYAAGTTTLLATYTDETQNTQNANPIILDANGRASVWLGSASYKFVLKDPSDVTQWTVDQVAAIDNGGVTTIKIADGAVTTQKLADLGVTTAKLADGNVTTAKIVNSGVTTVKIADLNVTTQKIADSNVTTVKIADSNVTTAKIADSNVTTAKILDANVTRAKLVAVGQQVTASCGAFSTNSTSYVQGSNLSIALTTTGRPVVIALIPDGTTNASSTASDAGGALKITRAVISPSSSTDIGIFGVPTGTLPISAVFMIDVVAAGTYTYSVSAKRTGGTSSAFTYISNAKLIVYEL